MTDPFTLLLQHAAPEIATDLVQTYRRLQHEDLSDITSTIAEHAADADLDFVETALLMLSSEHAADAEDQPIIDLIKAAIVEHILGHS